MKLKGIIITGVLVVGGFVVFAQKGRESLIQLQSNPKLRATETDYVSPIASFGQTHLSKTTSTGKRFPFIDYFNDLGGELSDSLWALKSVKVLNDNAVFNSENASGTVYSNADGSFGEMDVMLSKDIDINSSNGQLFISFNYSTGSTWEPNDSLILEMETGSGIFVKVWSSPNTIVVNRKVIQSLDLTLFQSVALNFRFVNYAKRTITNTQNYLLHQLNFSDKIALPYYENMLVSSIDNTLEASPVYWEQAQSEVVTGKLFSGTNGVIFNAYRKDGTIYNNAGFGDTMQSQPIDLGLFQPSDSIFLSFYYQSQPSASSSDSLLLEFQNNLGQWIRVWQVGATNTGLTLFSRQINIGRFRSNIFQYRLVNKTDYGNEDTLQFIASAFSVGAKLLLPFVDDFSSSTLFPSDQKWLDKHVYINNDFAINPPSLNVATFDGLDFRGNAYGAGNGYLDTLTSAIINLGGLKNIDSVYCSFFVEPKGLGEMPNETDTLLLEFRSNAYDPNSWTPVWIGLSQNFSSTEFTPVYIFVDSVFLHHDFQFRYRNYGSKTGNIDNWHLDYVRLDKGRSIRDGFFDFAITANPPSLLNIYASMPQNHFNANPLAYTNSNQTIGLSNNDTTAFPLNYGRLVFGPNNNKIDSFGNTQPNIGATSIFNASIVSSVNLSAPLSNDSMVFTSRYFVNQNNNFDNILTNDNLNVRTILSNYFAYDDGTAEAGYGIEIEPGAVALGYNLEVPDVLYGISMFFNQSFSDISSQVFNIMVWSNIGTNGDGTGEVVLKNVLQSRPTYLNQRNGFYYLQFSEPIALPAGKFYIGWEQNDVFQLNMGLDLNYKINGVLAKNPDMWYHVKDGVWGKTQLAGALMMRPIVGKWLNPPVGNVEIEKNEFEVTIYPNPAINEIVIQAQTVNTIEIKVIDIAGRTVAGNVNYQKNVHLPQLSSGMYFVKVTDIITGHTQIKKLIINQ